MTVERFRSIEEMPAALARRRSSDGFERFLRHCARYRALAPRDRPRGVFRFRSLEEAQRARLRGHELHAVLLEADAPRTHAPGFAEATPPAIRNYNA